MNGFPITRYRMRQVQTWVIFGIVLIAAVFVLGNIITALVKDRVRVKPGSYVLKDGFPMFTDAREYIRLVRTYPKDHGTKIVIHTFSSGETFWDVSRRYDISLGTIIAANPFLTSLQAAEGMEIVVPLTEGVLMPLDNREDVAAMGKLIGNSDPRGDYGHSIFELLCIDDMRFAFFENSKPEIVSAHLQKLYDISKTFSRPVAGYYTSFYGGRMDPIFHRPFFHNGLDIKAHTGRPIRPVTEGIVTFAGWHEGLGLTVKIIHPKGYVSMYGHCASISVEQGRKVDRNSVIATVGSTGRSTGSHLHFIMMRHGKTIDPLLFIW